MIIRRITQGMIGGLLVLAAGPAAAAETPAGKGQQPGAKKERQICSYSEGLGSRLRTKVCMSES